jgi:hypothetical protein
VRCAIKENRLHKRVYSEEKCLLQVRNEYYPATVKNISFGGALVHSYNPIGLNVGDSCNVSMNGDSLREYPCKVARVETPNIALEFTSRRILIVEGQGARILLK